MYISSWFCSIWSIKNGSLGLELGSCRILSQFWPSCSKSRAPIGDPRRLRLLDRTGAALNRMSRLLVASESSSSINFGDCINEESEVLSHRILGYRALQFQVLLQKSHGFGRLWYHWDCACENIFSGTSPSIDQLVGNRTLTPPSLWLVLRCSLTAWSRPNDLWDSRGGSRHNAFSRSAAWASATNGREIRIFGWRSSENSAWTMWTSDLTPKWDLHMSYYHKYP